jgi:hypothetical protein
MVPSSETSSTSDTEAAGESSSDPPKTKEPSVEDETTDEPSDSDAAGDWSSVPYCDLAREVGVPLMGVEGGVI